MVTLTMFSLEDFVLEAVRCEAEELRCEALRVTSGGGQMGPKVTFQIVCTFRMYDEVTVCKLVIGKTWLSFLDGEPWHKENLEKAHVLVQTYLANWGYAVYPGIYAHEGADSAASCALWRIDRDTHCLEAVAADTGRD